MKNTNQNLFMYGLMALLIQFIGVIILVAGLFLAFVHIAFLIAGVILGIAVVIKGKAMRFDYKRRSGYIVHSGDR